ncbi:MAG: hypothetical protein QXW97_03310 [Candidatus Pacearchaeota archaeon]
MKLSKRVKQRIVITTGIAIILILVFYLISSAITKYTGYTISQNYKENDFKHCIKEKKIILFVNTNDVVQTLKQLSVNEYLEYMFIKNCMVDNTDCINREVRYFPTFLISENKIEKDISVEELSFYSNCKI